MSRGPAGRRSYGFPSKRLTHTPSVLGLFRTWSFGYSNDAVILATLTKVQSADAVILKTASVQQSGDAIVKATLTRTASADAVIKATLTRVQFADAVIKATLSKAQTADAVVKKTASASHSSDALVAVRHTVIQSADAILRATITRAQSVDAIVKATLTRTQSADAVIKKSLSASASTDADIQAPVVGVSGLDHFTSTANSTSYASPNTVTPVAGAHLVAYILAAGTVDSGTTFTGYGLTWTLTATIAATALAGSTIYKYEVDTGVTTAPTSAAATFNCPNDAATGVTIAIFQIVGLDRTHPNKNAYTASGAASKPTITLGKAPSPGNAFTAFATVGSGTPTWTVPGTQGWTQYVSEGQTVPAQGAESAYSTAITTVGPHTWGGTNGTWDLLVDEWTLPLVTHTPSHGADAVIKATFTKVQSADAVIRATLTKTQGADAVIKATLTRAQSADAVLKKTLSVSAESDAFIALRITLSHGADAMVLARFTRAQSADAVVRKTGTQGHASDATIRLRIFKTHSSDAILRATFHDTHTVDAIIRKTVRLVQTSDAIIRATLKRAHQSDAILRATLTRGQSVDAVILEIKPKPYVAAGGDAKLPGEAEGRTDTTIITGTAEGGTTSANDAISRGEF